MTSERVMPNVRQIGKADSFQLIQDASFSQGNFSNSLNRMKSGGDSPNMIGMGLFGNSGKGQSSNRLFECTTPIEDSSMGESPNFFESFGKNNENLAL